MRNPILLLISLFSLFVLNACHRPYALVQRTPMPRFESPAARQTPSTLIGDSLAKSALAQTVNDTLPEQGAKTEPAFVSVASVVAEPAARPMARRIGRMESLLAESKKTVTEQPRPRPKSKNQLRLGNRIRQSLGLPLREELNWWQRIDWKLKSSVFVIGVAIVFAILGLGQLALIFGLIGALLLVLGLKRSFKKRRPWL